MTSSRITKSLVLVLFFTLLMSIDNPIGAATKATIAKAQIARATSAVVNPNIHNGIGYLAADTIQSINIEDDKYTSPAAIKKILKYLNSIKFTPISDKTQAAESPAGGIPLKVVINLKVGNKIKTEYVALYIARYMVDVAYDKSNKLIYRRYYFPKSNLKFEMEGLCNEINKDKSFKINLDVTNINSYTIESITLKNRISMTKTIREKSVIKSVVDTLKSIRTTETTETIKNTSTMKMSVVYKGDYEIKKQNFYFTDKLMQYKAYDGSEDLLSVGFYKIDKNILQYIDNLVSQKTIK